MSKESKENEEREFVKEMNEEVNSLIQPLLSVKQVAKILNISEYTVRNYLKESKIKGLKLKRMWRMTLEEINQWLVKAQVKAVDEIKEKERKRKENHEKHINHVAKTIGGKEAQEIRDQDKKEAQRKEVE